MKQVRSGRSPKTLLADQESCLSSNFNRSVLCASPAETALTTSPSGPTSTMLGSPLALGPRLGTRANLFPKGVTSPALPPPT